MAAEPQTESEQQARADVIDRIAERARQRAPVWAGVIERFVRQLYAGVPPDAIAEDSLDNLAGAALAVWDLLQRRTPGAPSIRVYDPRPEVHGWASAATAVEVVNDDMPFLVDSVKGELEARGAEVLLIVHPVVSVERDAKGGLAALHEPEAASGLRESLIQIRATGLSPERHEAVAGALAAVLADVRAAVEDWLPMRERGRAIVDELEASPPPLPAPEIAEGLAFLRWLEANHFTYLGYREYRFEEDGESAVARVLPGGLGLLRDESYTVFEGLRNLGTLPPEVRQFVRQPVLLAITKSNRVATVHRRAPLDTVAVKCFDGRGRVTGERLFVGLFTTAAYSRSPREIPVQRAKVARVLERAGFAPDSHDGRTLLHILEGYPRDELFQTSEDDLYACALGILSLQERQHRTALFVRRDPFERFVSCLVYVPRDRYSTRLQRRFQEILAEAYAGKVTSAHVQLSDAPLARLHIVVATTPGAIPPVEARAVEARLAEVSRSWADRLGTALVAAHGDEEGARLLSRYGQAFPASYQNLHEGSVAITDIAKVERALAEGGLAVELYRPGGAEPRRLRFKIYSAGQPVPLSDVLPMLENMGLKVVDERPWELSLPGLGPVLLRDFDALAQDVAEVDVDAVRDAFHEAFARVFRGEMENDGFNRLVLSAGLVDREVVVLRAYAKYLRQAAIPFSQASMERALAAHPEVARHLVDLFHARFDPRRPADAPARVAALSAALRELLAEVQDQDEDRILRRFMNLVEATLRTNFYQRGADGRPKPYLSFKLDSQAIEDLPSPRPFREIFVFSPRVEAIHLRGGRVARGGIRWSDRREDFRTEVLGLMKAQMVKNAVIVPVGSKGGFVVKRPPAGSAGDRKALQAEGIECYKMMMRGLLDLTDNLVGDAVVPPPDVVRHDDDDPYLVVAADKGTAAFSDIANGIAAEYGFWLDDAFASGGSSGYDHKRMAITSRGVWESVKRHFRELGKDVQREDVTVVGIGDMAGDVFGNGMLMSEHIRLVGAFNHLHVFVDPNPDAASSYRERQRLFTMPGSSWADYDRSLISPGGGVFERSLRSIEVTPEMAERFGIAAPTVTPSELIQAMLRTPVELLFFGGIGTFVKASDESHADVKDRANDALRVDALEIPALVIAEGANLGMTQRARIEYALKGGPEGRGGRLNTDFIDNSAGVDCSDHEVNIKILLGEAERAGRLTRAERDELLRAMTDEVAELVLRDNYLQTQAISVTHRFGVHLLDRVARFMRTLERASLLDRRLEGLPDEDDVAERASKKLGFTRPELAVLLAYSKLALYGELVASTLPDDPYMQEDLKLYFPRPLRERFAAETARHRLRREIIATAVTNSIVNRVGITFLHETKEKTALPAADIARAYVISREVFGLRPLWQGIESLDNRAPAEIQAMMLAECGRLLESGTVWFLRKGPHPLDVGREIAVYAPGVAELAAGLEPLLSEDDRAWLAERVALGVRNGVQEDLARRVAALALLVPAGDVVDIARARGLPVLRAAAIYFAVGDRFGFDWLRRKASELPRDNAWDKRALSAVIDDLFGHQRELTLSVLSLAGDGRPDETVIERWAATRRQVVTRTEQLLAELQAAGTPSLAMLAVANLQLKAMGV